MVKAWKNRINAVKWGLFPDIQLTECEGVWPGGWVVFPLLSCTGILVLLCDCLEMTGAPGFDLQYFVHFHDSGE